LVREIRHAYIDLELNCRVETQIHLQKGKPSEEINEFKHLYPEVLLKSMAKCSGIIVKPQTNYTGLSGGGSSSSTGSATRVDPAAAFVIAPPVKDDENKLVTPKDVTHKFNKQRELQLWLGEQSVRPQLSRKVARKAVGRFLDAKLEEKKPKLESRQNVEGIL